MAAADDTSPPATSAAPGKRESYTDWLVDNLIQPILEAVDCRRNFEDAVRFLKRSTRDGRYDRLTATTVRGWFQRGSFTDLKPGPLERIERSALALASLPTTMGGGAAGGHAGVFADHLPVRDHILMVLVELAAAGTCLTVPAVRACIKGIVTAKAPVLLERGWKVSQSWVKCFLKTFLNWTYRWVRGGRMLAVAAPAENGLWRQGTRILL